MKEGKVPGKSFAWMFFCKGVESVTELRQCSYIRAGSYCTISWGSALVTSISVVARLEPLVLTGIAT